MNTAPRWSVTTLLLLAAVACLTLASCATPEQTTAVVAATIGAAGAFVDALGPVLDPEMKARLLATANQIDGTVGATAEAVRVLAEAVGNVRDAAAGNAETFGEAMQNIGGKIAELPSRAEMWLTSSGIGTGAVGGSRILSHYKHTTKA